MLPATALAADSARSNLQLVDNKDAEDQGVKSETPD